MSWAKLKAIMPAFPRRRYNVFFGSNSFVACCQTLRDLVLKKPLDDQETILEYESVFAKNTGASHAISFGAGRMALFAILEALNIGSGDEVIIPAFTCVVVPNALKYRGACPVYVDIESQCFNINVAQVEAAITPRTKALYAQHTFGVPCDVDALRDLGRQYGLPVIEDAAHALGAVWQGRRVGSLTEVAFFSTDHSKVINTHLGGMAVTSDDTIALRLRKIQASAPFLDEKITRRLIRTFLLEYVCFLPRVLWIGRTVHAVLGRLKLFFYFHDELDTTKPTAYPYPCRLSSAQAKLGIAQLLDLKQNLAHRKNISDWLEKKINWYGLSTDKINESTWLRYSFLVKDREKFQTKFNKHFDLGIWFTSVVSGRSEDLEVVSYQRGSCPVAEFVVQHIVNFPTHARVPLEIIQKEIENNWSWLHHDIQYQTRFKSVG